MNQVDLVKLGLWKPGYAYPSPGEWHLGIDNLGIRALP